MAEQTLRPCPFCNSERVRVASIRDGILIMCVACYAKGPPIFHGPEGWEETQRAAGAAWNGPTRSAAIAELVESAIRLEVAANTVSYCYSNRPENFAVALRELQDDADVLRTKVNAVRGGANS